MADLEALRAADEALQDAVFTGCPPFMDVPEEVREKLEKQSVRAERLFWLRVGDRLKDTPELRLMLRRAVYAEQRCWEMENMLAEMALITKGASATVRELADATDQAVPGE